jgi:hypothetical protein
MANRPDRLAGLLAGLLVDAEAKFGTEPQRRLTSYAACRWTISGLAVLGAIVAVWLLGFSYVRVSKPGAGPIANLGPWWLTLSTGVLWCVR